MYAVDTIGDLASPPVPPIPGNPFPSLETWLQVPGVPQQVPGLPQVAPQACPPCASCSSIPIAPVVIAFGLGALVAFVFLKR